ncbi:MAG TPA: hypothetical protein VL068_08905, partial [Microthrixaceae bacterium]|nr:hypothetical protein [Microthrixaceae bacterium]
MNDTTRQRVIDRIESLAEAALTEVQVPPFAADHHRTAADSPPIRSPRRRILVAAAVTISVAAAGAVLAIYVNSGTRSIRAAGSDPAAGVDAIVPAHWPAGVDSGITTHVDISTLRPREMDDRVGSAVLELDGHAAAAVETVESSLRSISATPPDGRPLDSTPGVLDGRSTLWRNQPDGTLIGYVAVAESRTMIIASRTVDRTELERLEIG